MGAFVRKRRPKKVAKPKHFYTRLVMRDNCAKVTLKYGEAKGRKESF